MRCIVAIVALLVIAASIATALPGTGRAEQAGRCTKGIESSNVTSKSLTIVYCGQAHAQFTVGGRRYTYRNGSCGVTGGGGYFNLGLGHVTQTKNPVTGSESIFSGYEFAVQLNDYHGPRVYELLSPSNRVGPVGTGAVIATTGHGTYTDGGVTVRVTANGHKGTVTGMFNFTPPGGSVLQPTMRVRATASFVC